MSFNYHYSLKVFTFVCDKYKDKKCFGVRKIIREEQETGADGKTSGKYVLGNYTWKTYLQVNERCTSVQFWQENWHQMTFFRLTGPRHSERASDTSDFSNARNS